MKQILLIDRESNAGKRGVFAARWDALGATSFEDAVEKYNKIHPEQVDFIVQFVDGDTGETVKGARYDTTTQPTVGPTVEKGLQARGIKQKPPIEPAQYEPRDRFQENSNMKMTKEKFQTLVSECITELRKEKKVSQLKEGLRGVVREVLKEISSNSKPKLTKDEEETVNKGYSKKGNEQVDKDNLKLADELEKIVHAINSDWAVYWDDNGELKVDAQNQLSIRVSPKFENNFDIDIMVKLCDRIRVIAVTWEQVKATVKANLTDLAKQTNAEKAHDDQIKVSTGKDEEKGKDAGPRHDITKKKEVGDTKKDNKDYNEKAVTKDEDEPSAPMKDVGDKKGLNKDIEKTSSVKSPKHKSNEGDDKLRVELSGTKKHRFKKG